MRPVLPIAGFFIALSGFFFEFVLGNWGDYSGFSAMKIIEKYGYPAESHIVETEDGYFLQVHRIPYGKNSEGVSPKGPLLLLHGVLTSSDVFLLEGPNSLAFVAADKGYDVWLVNFRGTHYSKLHRSLSTKSIEFWNFSFHESGFYDLPAQIDYVCNYTQRNDVALLGHSYGTTVVLVMATARPEYQKKVRAAVLVSAPSVFIHRKNLFLPLAPIYPTTYSKKFTNSEVIGDNAILRRIIQILEPLDNKGMQTPNIPPLPILKSIKIALDLLRLYPASNSLKVFAHYYQLALSGKFRQYDYGPAENLKRYKSCEPPEYDLESITIPMVLAFTPNDILAGKEDEEYLIKRMKNIKRVVVIKNKGFRHPSLVIGKYNKEPLYEELLDLLENVTNVPNYAKDEGPALPV